MALSRIDSQNIKAKSQQVGFRLTNSINLIGGEHNRTELETSLKPIQTVTNVKSNSNSASVGHTLAIGQCGSMGQLSK